MGNYLLGVDIGTTNISAVIIDCDKRKIVETHTVPNNSRIKTERDFSEYDAEWITEKAVSLINNLVAVYPDIKGIGLTGQMHGFVYVSADGKAISPFYNWQDGRGNRLSVGEKTYCQEIEERTGYVCNSGYAFATMFYNHKNHLEPKEATSFCSIMDYIAMVLTGRKAPLIHISNAASFGLCDIKNNQFDIEAVEKLNLTHIILPEIAKSSDIAGYYRNIPVAVAIGDNQASFFGSVKDEKTTALVNIGTGSQVSVVSDQYMKTAPNLEIRPYLFGKYLVSGSALCGGKAYAILEQFFADYVYEMTGTKESQYEIMNKIAEKSDINSSHLQVSTLFSGTRYSPKERGSISHIDDTNFTPGNLIIGVLYGMSNELKSYFDSIGQKGITHIVASGNAVKMNPVLQKILRNTFHSSIEMTKNNEEAAIGSALFAGVLSGLIERSFVKDFIVSPGIEKGTT